MKANNGSGNNTERDNWETPAWLFQLLNKQYNFEFDCCANEKNTKCKYYSKNFSSWKMIGYEYPYMNFWMNPPFSKAKKMFEHFFRVVNNGVAIYRCDNMETKIWQDVILKYANWVFIPQGRVAYSYNPELRQGKGTRFPSALIGIGVNPPKELNGKVLIPRK